MSSIEIGLENKQTRGERESQVPTRIEFGTRFRSVVHRPADLPLNLFNRPVRRHDDDFVVLFRFG